MFVHADVNVHASAKQRASRYEVTLAFCFADVMLKIFSSRVRKHDNHLTNANLISREVIL